MSSPKCLRCGAGPEWIQGKVPKESPDTKDKELIDWLSQEAAFQMVFLHLEGRWELTCRSNPVPLGVGKTIREAIRSAMAASKTKEAE